LCWFGIAIDLVASMSYCTSSTFTVGGDRIRMANDSNTECCVCSMSPPLTIVLSRLGPQKVSQSISHVLRHDKMQADKLNQKGNTLSKRNKPL